MPEPVYQPLSVRNAIRDPLPYHEGAPSHIRQSLESAVYNALVGASVEDLAEPLLLQLQIPRPHRGTDVVSAIQGYYKGADTALLDVVDYVIGAQLSWSGSSALEKDGVIGEIANILNLGASVWEVVMIRVTDETAPFGPAVSFGTAYRASLQRRVPETEEQLYLSALGIGGQAEEHLSSAWRAAYGRPDNPTGAWQHAASAVEAALQPIVEPTNPKARLGAMRSKITQGPTNFRCKLPLWNSNDATDSVQAFTQCLSRVIYESGRHGADTDRPTQDQAQAVLAQAVTICEWIRIGIFTRAES